MIFGVGLEFNPNNHPPSSRPEEAGGARRG